MCERDEGVRSSNWLACIAQFNCLTGAAATPSRVTKTQTKRACMETGPWREELEPLDDELIMVWCALCTHLTCVSVIGPNKHVHWLIKVCVCVCEMDWLSEYVPGEPIMASYDPRLDSHPKCVPLSLQAC